MKSSAFRNAHESRMAQLRALGIVDAEPQEQPATSERVADPEAELELVELQQGIEDEVSGSVRAQASFGRIKRVFDESPGAVSDAHYDVIFRETIGEGANSKNFGSKLLTWVGNGQVGAYLKPVLLHLLRELGQPPAQERAALFKISRILLLHTTLVPERIKAFADAD